MRKATEILAPHERLRGKKTRHRRSVVVCQFLLSSLVAGEACGDAGNRDARLRWSRPGIAGEPILPTPPMMRPHRSWWASRRGNALWSVRQRKELHVLPAPMGHPAAAKRSAGHIHESRIGPSRTGLYSTGTGAGRGKRRRTALTRRARSPLAPEARHCSRNAQR